jgi:hypothetical protein
MGIACCYAGPVEEGEKVVRPLRAFGSPVLDLCEPKPYVEHQAMFDPSYPHGWWYYIRACITAAAEGFDEEREWSRSFWSALEPYHTSVYVNFLMEVGEERIREAYGPEKYDRLKALKRRYDPNNFFRLNQNIPPS